MRYTRFWSRSHTRISWVNQPITIRNDRRALVMLRRIFACATDLQKRVQ